MTKLWHEEKASEKYSGVNLAIHEGNSFQEKGYTGVKYCYNSFCPFRISTRHNIVCDANITLGVNNQQTYGRCSSCACSSTKEQIEKYTSVQRHKYTITQSYTLSKHHPGLPSMGTSRDRVHPSWDLPSGARLTAASRVPLFVFRRRPDGAAGRAIPLLVHSDDNTDGPVSVLGVVCIICNDDCYCVLYILEVVCVVSHMLCGFALCFVSTESYT